jgi:capsular polysaccharide biosynthesis protein
MDTAWQNWPTTGTRTLTARPASDLLPAISAGAFGARQEGYVEAIGAGALTLPPVSCAGPVTIQRPLNMPPQPEGFLAAVRYPRLTVARLHDATCLPGGVALVGEESVLLESFSAPWEADYHNDLDRAGGGWQVRNAIETVTTLDGPTLFIDYQHSAFFGHFIADALSRCWAIDYCRAWLRTDIRKILITEPVPDFISTMLRGLGVWTIPLRVGQAVRCRELIVATKAFQIQEYIAPPALALWSRLRASLSVPGDCPTRLFISRRRNPTRKLAEEEAVEALFARYGFTIFIPEDHDIRTQVSMFAGARLIAGCSGSNMFNIAFQREAAAILILVSPLLVHYSEHFFSAGHNARLSYFPGYVTDAQMAATPGYVHAPWHVDMAELADYVAGWVGSVGDGC